LEVRFSVRIDGSPAQFRWQFGDGGESPVAEPVHAYAKPGTYRVAVTIQDPKLGEQTRQADVIVPAGTLQQARTRS
jgi:PKD repeat protein